MMRRKSAKVENVKMQVPTFGNDKIIFYDWNDLALIVAKLMVLFDTSSGAKQYKCGGVEIFDLKDSYVISIPYQGRKYVMFIVKNATDEEIFDGLAKIAAERSEQLAVLRDIKCNIDNTALKDRLAFIVTSISMLIA